MNSANHYALPAHATQRIPTDLLIGSKWEEGTGKTRIPVVNPSTGDTLTSVANASVADAIRAIDAAQNAATAWSATAPRARAELLRACFEKMVANVEWLAQLISLENGKALNDAKGEVLYAAEFFR